jgi:hypothetical protein
MASGAPAVVPTFDSAGRLRLLPVSAAAATEELEREAREFVSELQEFSATVSSVVESMGAQAAVIEAEKLRAIGFRMLAEQEKQQRARKLRELPALIEERNMEIARLSAELESLLKVEAEQKEVIERLQQ